MVQNLDSKPEEGLAVEGISKVANFEEQKAERGIFWHWKFDRVRLWIESAVCDWRSFPRNLISAANLDRLVLVASVDDAGREGRADESPTHVGHCESVDGRISGFVFEVIYSDEGVKMLLSGTQTGQLK